MNYLKIKRLRPKGYDGERHLLFMRKKYLCLMLMLSICCTATAQNKQVHTFTVGDKEFLLDGKPFVIKAAEIHYLRIPHEYWEHRIKMCKALGMNTMCAYVFWNAHEQQEGVYDFEGDRDLARFVALCQKHGMWVILRPGPYSCAEWEMGGIPWWLLKYNDIKLRSTDERFMRAATRFERKVSEVLEPYKLKNGGNIILVQVENEFGSYGTDKLYMAAVRDSLRSVGWADTEMFQCDWSSNFMNNALDDLTWTLNFGANVDVVKQFDRMRQMRPNTPLMCSEFWSGWFDGWGQKHQTRPSDAMVKGIGTMLSNGISFSLYMTHGGTSFGHWAGANNKGYVPDCTSYDYDAPINEQGSATEKYYKLRDLLQQYSDTRLPAVPKPIPIIEISAFQLKEFAPLMSSDNLPESQLSERPLPMEQYNQGWGSIVYSTTLPQVDEGALLRISDMCDYARVYINGQLIGQLYRGNGYETTLHLPAISQGARLDIFIEAMGRINFSTLIHDRKGITDRVEVLTTSPEGHQLTYDLRHWQVRLLPVSYDFSASRNFSAQGSGEGYYKGTFRVKKVGDTFLDLSSWGKGLVWVNGHCLGRFWQIGPQQTLYLPGCWLKKGDNEVIVMDIDGPREARISGLSTPIIDQLHRELLPRDAVKGEAVLLKPTKKEQQPRGAGNDAAPGAK